LYVNGSDTPCILHMVETKREGTGAANGPELFTQICAACHGLNREGNPLQSIPTLVGVEKKMKAEDIVKMIDTGKGVMPSFAFLSAAQKNALANFLIDPKATAKPIVADAASDEPSGLDLLGKIPYGMTGYNRGYDTNGYPAIKPPWGTLS